MIGLVFVDWRVAGAFFTKFVYSLAVPCCGERQERRISCSCSLRRTSSAEGSSSSELNISSAILRVIENRPVALLLRCFQSGCWPRK